MGGNPELNCSSNRPAAWTRGEYSQSACGYVGAQLWTACDADVLLLNGEAGAIEQTIAGVGSFFYGGAADGDGNFWGLDTGNGQFLRIDIDDFSVQTWPLGPTNERIIWAQATRTACGLSTGSPSRPRCPGARRSLVRASADEQTLSAPIERPSPILRQWRRAVLPDSLLNRQLAGR